MNKLTNPFPIFVTGTLIAALGFHIDNGGFLLAGGIFLVVALTSLSDKNSTPPPSSEE